MRQKTPLILFLLFVLAAPQILAQTYEELREAVRTASDPGREIPGLSAQQAHLRKFWETGKLIDAYLLERSERAIETVNHLAEDLNDDHSRLYYRLQFARTYPDSPPKWDLPWGFHQYLLSINHPREREELMRRAFEEKWNWDTLRAEVKKAGRDNKEFVFTDIPGKTGVYRVMRAKYGHYRGQLVLDLGFFNDYLPSKLKFEEYAMVQAECRRSETKISCKLKPAPGAEKDLFTYEAEVIEIIDGDTFKALVNLGFGMTTRQTFRLWGLDAPEINTPQGRKAKKFLEELLLPKSILLRAMDNDKYGRFLADVWSLMPEKNKPLYVNQELISRGLAAANKRE